MLHTAFRNTASRNMVGHMQPSHSTLLYSGLHSGFQWSLRVIALVGLCTSSYLAWVAFNSGSVAGCGSGDTFDCSHVLSSRWSSLLGIPVSYPAVLLYALVSVLLIAPANWISAQWRWSLVTFAAFLAGLGGLWFIGLQVFLLKHLCVYCLIVHGCGLVLATLVATHPLTRRYVSVRLVAAAAIAVLGFIAAQIMLPAAEKFEIIEYESAPAAEIYAPPSGTAPLEQPTEVVPANDHNNTQQGEIFESPLHMPSQDSSTSVSPRRHSWLFGLHPALLLTAQVTTSQPASSEEKKAEAAPAERKLVSILNGVQLDVRQWPLLGNVDAEYVIVEMLDYTCGHCQNTHAAIHGAMQAYGDRLAVIVLAVPMDTKCNPHVNSTPAQHRESCEIAKLSIAVWHLAPQRFTEFHNWLMESKPNYSQALAHAESIIYRGKLQAELQSSVPAAFVRANVDLYRRASAGAIPKILFPRTSAIGEMRSKESLISLIEKELVQKSK